MKCYNFQIITAVTAVVIVLSDLTTDGPVEVQGGGNFQSKINISRHELSHLICIPLGYGLTTPVFFDHES